MPSTFQKYELSWKDGTDDAEIERYMIQKGGQWVSKGKEYGLGLITHFKFYWKALWPEDSQTWWTDLILKEILANQFVSLVGPASAWKSGTVARMALMDWSCFPDCTTVMMSSTDMEGLRSRIYGETTMMWQRASESHPWFPGHPIDSKCVITNQDVEFEKARDLRDSVLGIPCKTSSGKWQGMGKFSGRKNRRVWCIGDEFQFMELSILEAQNNLVSNGPNLVPGIVRDKSNVEYGKPLRGYKCVFIGNTNPSRPGNPLDIVSEPEHGFGSIPEDGKTKVWDCKKLADYPVKCRCINLDALDSPNSSHPADSPKWIHLAGPHKLSIYTEGSESYWSQGRGVFKFGLAAFKIITKEVCDQKHAFDPVVWKGMHRTKIGMCDASYGGGDRCPLGWLEFGECLDGKVRMFFHPYWLVPITIRTDLTPEDQIALFCKQKMEDAGVPPENFFFDGRGSLAMSFAEKWSSRVNSIEFGGRPTDRIAGPDIYTTPTAAEGRRLKLSSEHYSKFVSELWWSWRYAVDADQVRGLTLDIVMDAQPREWKKVAGDKIEIESKRDMKKRTGCSPDLADMVVTGIEGARRRGFQIARLGPVDRAQSENDWLEKEADEQDRIMKNAMLVH